ncbi:MAG: hypothetical protein IMX02_02740 [Limnochordaceae bacterium]|nr:hypothetical protein [Limnochordaceae bacterium]
MAMPWVDATGGSHQCFVATTVATTAAAVTAQTSTATATPWRACACTSGASAPGCPTVSPHASIPHRSPTRWDAPSVGRTQHVL